jgi:hypothetical protein
MNRLVIRSLFSAVLLLALLSLPSIASADSILWTLSGVTFSDGATASGSFDYNSATNTFSAIDIVTSTGNTYQTLSGPLGGFSSSVGLFLGATSGDLTSTPLLVLFFDNPLFNSGGTVTDPLATGLDFGGGEGTCGDAACGSQTEDRFITGGEATSTVAVVSALSLLCVAFAALLAGLAMRKASQA